jgi:hypothetical protein
MHDPKDPFFADGLKMRWIWVSGNHDVLSQGNFDVTNFTPEYVGTETGGTRDWSQPGGPVFSGNDVIPDAKRAPLIGGQLIAHVMADGDGHGVTQAAVQYGRGFYAVDIQGSPIRIIVADTTAPTGASEGLIVQSDIDQMMKPFLDQAQTDGKLVIVTSHHSSGRLTDGGGYGGTKHSDALTPDAWRNLLGSYSNVLMHLAGHTHRHHTIPDNGFIGIKAIVFDYSTEGDPIAAEGRRRAILDYTSGWATSGIGDVTDRNIELIMPKP